MDTLHSQQHKDKISNSKKLETPSIKLTNQHVSYSEKFMVPLQNPAKQENQAQWSINRAQNKKKPS